MFGIQTKILWIDGIAYEAIGLTLYGNTDHGMLYCAHMEYPIVFTEGSQPVEGIDSHIGAKLFMAFRGIHDDCIDYLMDRNQRNELWFTIKDKLDSLNKS